MDACDNERDIKRIMCGLHHLHICISCPLSVRSAEGLRLELINHLVPMTVQSSFLSIHYVPHSAVSTLLYFLPRLHCAMRSLFEALVSSDFEEHDAAVRRVSPG